MNIDLIRIARESGQLSVLFPAVAEREEILRLEREHAEAMVELKQGRLPRPQEAPSLSMGAFQPTDAITGPTYGRLLAALRSFTPDNPPRSKKSFQGDLEALGCDTREQEVFARIVAEHFNHGWRG